MATLRATYIGYHGDAREWYTDNPDLTVELLNRSGYWYFPHRVEIPETLRGGGHHRLRVVWENRGVAPAYHSYRLQVRLVGPQMAEFEFDAGNRRWLPGHEQLIHTEDYTLKIPRQLESGQYDLRIRLYARNEARPVLLALDPSLLDEQQHYTVGSIEIEELSPSGQPAASLHDAGEARTPMLIPRQSQNKKKEARVEAPAP